MTTIRERLTALRGGSGTIAAVLLALKATYELIDAAGNVDFVIQRIPTVGRLLNSILSTNFLILPALVLIIAILLWPAELGPGGSRLRRMKVLLSEARAFHEKHAETVKKFSDDSVHDAAWRMSKIFTFLHMAFAGGGEQDLAKYQDREHLKHKAANAAFDPDRTIAKYLSDLKGRVCAQDLDPSFHMPDNYEQFYRTDEWVANSVESKNK